MKDLPMPEVGRTYTCDKGIERKVEKVTASYVTYFNAVKDSHLMTNIHTFQTQYMGIGKPLDQIFKREYFNDVPKICTHRNQSKEQYFTSYTYITCKDCGKALN